MQSLRLSWRLSRTVAPRFSIEHRRVLLFSDSHTTSSERRPSPLWSSHPPRRPSLNSARQPSSTQMPRLEKPHELPSTQLARLSCRDKRTPYDVSALHHCLRPFDSQMIVSPRRSPRGLSTRKSARHPRSTQMRFPFTPHERPSMHELLLSWREIDTSAGASKRHSRRLPSDSQRMMESAEREVAAKVMRRRAKRFTTISSSSRTEGNRSSPPKS